MYRYDYSGKLLNQVTSGNWEVVIVHGVNTKKKTIYYSSTEDSPLERHLYSVRFDGKKKTKMSKVEGRHRINVSPNGEYYLDTYSNVNLPTQVELWNTKGKMLKKLVDNKEVKEYINQHVYAPKELMSFTTSYGQKLDTYVIKPIGFDENKRYPMVLNIYGGPESQSVYNEFATNGWEQYLAQEGFVVVSVNNRGGGGYGAKFEKIVYENLGHHESMDYVATANHFATLPWIDGDNMAIRGHSYGGYISSYTTLKHPGVFKVAIVTAPVTDWRLYDSIYAERYMGLLPENQKKYIESASTTYAGNLQGKMLLSHSTMDENVHVQNTFQLVKELIDNGKDVDLKIYPPGAHNVAYDGNSYVLLYTQYVNYLKKHLK
jgi:dipeptidyl-peptidase-4